MLQTALSIVPTHQPVCMIQDKLSLAFEFTLLKQNMADFDRLKDILESGRDKAVLPQS